MFRICQSRASDAVDVLSKLALSSSSSQSSPSPSSKPTSASPASKSAAAATVSHKMLNRVLFACRQSADLAYASVAVSLFILIFIFVFLCAVCVWQHVSVSLRVGIVWVHLNEIFGQWFALLVRCIALALIQLIQFFTVPNLILVSFSLLPPSMFH